MTKKENKKLTKEEWVERQELKTVSFAAIPSKTSGRTINTCYQGIDGKWYHFNEIEDKYQAYLKE